MLSRQLAAVLQPRMLRLRRLVIGVVEQARCAPRCLDFTISADLVDTGRINIFERWESQDTVEDFRGSGSSGEQPAAILFASVPTTTSQAYEP